MPDLTRGYKPTGRGNNEIVQDIINQASIDMGIPEPFLAKQLFERNFMPYARSHWQYDGTMCNCEDLSNAFSATWSYFKNFMRPEGMTNLAVLGRAEAVRCSPYGMISKAWPVFAGPAHGNVRGPHDGELDGRCLFANHWVCKIGMTYFDATYARCTTNPADVVERSVKKLNADLWVTKDAPYFLYLHNRADPAPKFSDSWNEMDATGWISATDWKAKTARFGHTRSADLAKLDIALDAFEKGGFPKLAQLKKSFTEWYARNPKEASTRNFENCVGGLAGFLKVAVHAPV